MANAYTYNARADGHRGQPDQRARRRDQHRHGHRHRLHRCHAPSTSGLEPGHLNHRDQLATTLTVVAPSGTGTVDVTVTTPNGTSAINAPSDQYTYNAPAPTVTGVSPTNGPPAGTNTVTVTGTGFDRATGVDFGTNAGTSIVVNSSTPRSPSSPRRAPAPWTSR